MEVQSIEHYVRATGDLNKTELDRHECIYSMYENSITRAILLCIHSLVNLLLCQILEY